MAWTIKWMRVWNYSEIIFNSKYILKIVEEEKLYFLSDLQDGGLHGQVEDGLQRLRGLRRVYGCRGEMKINQI